MKSCCQTGVAALGKEPHLFQKKSGGLPTAATILIFAVRAYRWTLSPAQVFLFGAGGCRFTPTCSVYAIDAVRQHGAVAGTAMAAKRICHCHPWGGCGHDPVPKAESGKRKAENQFSLGNSI